MSDIVVRETDLDTMTLGRVLSKSGYFADARDEAQAIVKVLAGRELGIGPIASMTGIYIVKGRVTLSANLIGATIKRSGKYDYRVIDHSDQHCELAFFENKEEVGRSSFDHKAAQAAGLLVNDTWKKFPRNMYFARALSNGARWYCPDVFSGPVYTPEELGEQVNEEGEVITLSPKPALPAPIVESNGRKVDTKTGEILETRADERKALLEELAGLRERERQLGGVNRALGTREAEAMSVGQLRAEIVTMDERIASLRQMSPARPGVVEEVDIPAR